MPCPTELKEMVESGQPARMRYDLDGEMQFAVGVPIPSADVAYFEIVSLDDVEDTLERTRGVAGRRRRS